MKANAPARRRNGQVVVLFATLALPAVLIMLVLTADIGQLLVTRARLQNTADAASLAAAQVLCSERSDGEGEAEARNTAWGQAVAVQQANCDQDRITVEFGSVDQDGNFAPAPLSTPAMGVRVRALRDEHAPGGSLSLFFSPFLGTHASDVVGSATTQIASNINGVLSGLSPFAVPESTLVPPGQEMTFYPAGDGDGPGQGKGQDKVAPGNWGLLNLNGGNHATPELRDWILNGYDDPLVIGDDGFLWVDGTPGFRCTLRHEIEERLGDVLTMVIYDEVTGQGSNANYRCVGFVHAVITSCDLTGGPGAHVTCRVEGVSQTRGLVVGGSTDSPNIRKIQLVN